MIHFVNANVTSTWPFRSGYFHAIVTSPPYWLQRQYATAEWKGGDPNCNHLPANRLGESGLEGSTATSGHQQQAAVCRWCGATKKDDRQLGLEENADCLRWAAGEPPELHCCFVCNTRIWAREAYRVLRDDGTLWLNLGDSYNGSGGGGGDYNAGGIREGQPLFPGRNSGNLAAGNLVGIPWRCALALQADGWILRSDVIWNKAEWVEETGLHDGTTMPGSYNGWRWERCKNKIKSTQRSAGRKGQYQSGKPQNAYGPDGRSMASNSDAYESCTGCDKCRENNGWILRQASWRPTTAHEQIFQLVKQMGNYGDREAVKAPAKLNSKQRAMRALDPKNKAASDAAAPGKHKFLGKPRERGEGYPLSGSNLRDVWRLKRTNYSGSHFAVFPPALPELCIKASTSEAGCCPICGAPWARVLETHTPHRHTGESETLYSENMTGGRIAKLRQAARAAGGEYENITETSGWMPTCEHDQDPVPCRVLDPFSGSGTTPMVANQLGRDGFGMDLSLQYIIENALVRTQQSDWKDWTNGDGIQAEESDLEGLPLFKGIS